MNRPPVTAPEYAAAVAALVPVALTDTGGGRAAAQVLLGAYNGYEFHVDLTDLCLLDAELLQDALTVIAGRAELRTEPQRLIVDGDEIFRRIAERWGHLCITRRYTER